jgi:hypothetical protein
MPKLPNKSMIKFGIELAIKQTKALENSANLPLEEKKEEEEKNKETENSNNPNHLEAPKND